MERSETWSDEYENILEFYFWEPQHLNRVSPAKEKRRPAKDVLSALMKREVPLNHQLNLFFHIAPRGLKARWLGGLLPATACEAPHLRIVRGSPVFGACQPDLYFAGERSRAFVELKVDARSGLEQLCKYGLLAAWLDQSEGPQPSGLIFMGPKPDKFADMDRHLADRLSPEFTLPPKVVRHAGRLGLSEEVVIAASRAMEIGYSTYGDFDGHLSGEAAGLKAAVEGDEALLNLVLGMRKFLRPVIGTAPAADGGVADT